PAHEAPAGVHPGVEAQARHRLRLARQLPVRRAQHIIVRHNPAFMTAPPPQLERLDVRLTRWMAHNGLTLLRISLGLVFFWFGFLKFFPGMSPADDLAARTIETISGGV